MSAQTSEFRLQCSSSPDLGAFLDQSICPVMILDRGFRYVFANEAYRKTVQRSEAELLGQSYFEVFPEAPEQEVSEIFRRALRGEPARLELHPFPAVGVGDPDNVSHWQAMLEPLRNKAGEAEYIVQRAQDVTAQVMLQKSVDVIAAELDHRVKNLLTIILATARITSASAVSVEQYTEEFCSRLESMTHCYNKLSANGWKGISFRELFDDELARVVARGSDRYSLKGDDIVLGLKASKDGAMVIHELVSNAAKHGCFTQPEGRLAIEWKVLDGMLRITWDESGLSGVQPPKKAGFGMKLLSMLPNARIRKDFRDTGLCLEYVVPVSLAVDDYEFVGDGAA